MSIFIIIGILIFGLLPFALGVQQITKKDNTGWMFVIWGIGFIIFVIINNFG